MENKINQQKDKIITACRILVNEGLTEGTFSLSCRADNNLILVNGKISPSLISRETILTYTLGEKPVGGKAHAAIYKAREDVNAIVHAHPPHAIALSTVEEKIIPIHNYGVIFHNKLKIYKSHGQVKTAERGEAIADLLGDGRAILQKGHGTLVVGKDLEEAILATIFLEEAARIQILAKIAGTPDAIPSELTDKITDQVLNEGSQKRVWDHYVAKLRHP